MTSMLVHDTRLAGTAPHLAPHVYKVNGATPLSQALGWISKYATSQRGLDQLLIMCHGLGGGVLDTNTQESDAELGFGLQLCRETLTLANVSATNILKGKANTIVLYACGPARTRPGYERSQADGWQFCRELAAFTNARVIASAHTQYYNTAPRSFFHQILSLGPQDEINFGPWEGSMMMINP